MIRIDFVSNSSSSSFLIDSSHGRKTEIDYSNALNTICKHKGDIYDYIQITFDNCDKTDLEYFKTGYNIIDNCNNKDRVRYGIEVIKHHYGVVQIIMTTNCVDVINSLHSKYIKKILKIQVDFYDDCDIGDSEQEEIRNELTKHGIPFEWWR